jgi:hypothetical protein
MIIQSYQDIIKTCVSFYVPKHRSKFTNLKVSDSMVRFIGKGTNENLLASADLIIIKK